MKNFINKYYLVIGFFAIVMMFLIGNVPKLVIQESVLFAIPTRLLETAPPKPESKQAEELSMPDPESHSQSPKVWNKWCRKT